MLDTLIKKHYKFIVIILISVFVLQAGASMLSKSATWDETTYVGAAQYLIKNHRWNVDGLRFHPPLLYYIHAIPLLFLNIPEQIWHIPDMTERGQKLLSLYPNDLVLNLVRLPILLIGVLLGIYLFIWARKLYGLNAGLFILLLYAFSPNLLAYAGLITFDFVPSFFIFIAFYYFWRVLDDCTKANFVMSGLTLGLALLSKLTAVVLLPIFLILMEFKLHYDARETPKVLSRKRSLALILGIFVIGFLVLWAGYGFEFRSLAQPQQRPYEILDKFLPQNSVIKNNAYFLIEKMPVPLRTYWWGSGYFYLMSNLGKPSFFMGMYSMHGWWYFFIIAFLIKTPLSVLLLLILSLVFLKKIKHKKILNELFICVPILFFMLFFSAKPANAIFRHVLPIYPFLFVFISKIINLKVKPQKMFNVIIFLLSLWLVGSSLFIYPDYLAYFNELIGGPNNGYKYMVDADLDWGQDLKGLKKYMVNNNIDKVKLSYFGTASPEYYGIKYDYLPSAASALGEPRDFPKPPIKGIIAISATELQGVYFKPYFEHKDYYAWLKKYNPIAKIGYSIFIYDIQ